METYEEQTSLRYEPEAALGIIVGALEEEGFENLETSADGRMLTATKLNAKMREARVVVWVEAADAGSSVTVRGAAHRVAAIFKSPARQAVKRAIKAMDGQ
ncbi:MAG TPA: hypothetical protein VHR88_13295 [Solirubrobacteraceae bacterium]|jgi:hypothetical protein|nr:hypothetical protein [Solirubrobacteraceae bacterium]